MYWVYYSLVCFVIAFLYYLQLRKRSARVAALREELRKQEMLEEDARWRKQVIKCTQQYADEGHYFLSSSMASEYVDGERWINMSDMDKYVLTLIVLEAEKCQTL